MANNDRTQFDNFSNTALADEIGALDREAKRISLDTKRIKDAMGQAWADTFSRLTEVTTIRVEAA